jgi:hypothetical protein
MGDRHPGGQHRQQGRKALGIAQGIEVRSPPVALEDDVVVSRHEERPGAVLARVAGRVLEGARIELFERRRHARGDRFNCPRHPLARLVERRTAAGERVEVQPPPGGRKNRQRQQQQCPGRRCDPQSRPTMLYSEHWITTAFERMRYCRC